MSHLLLSVHLDGVLKREIQSDGVFPLFSFNSSVLPMSINFKLYTSEARNEL